jgi:hypothetical protein
MQKITTLVSAIIFLLVLATPADARRGGGFHGGRGASVHRSANFRNVNINRNAYRANVNRNVNVNRTMNVNRDVNINRSVNVNRRYVYRNGQRGYWRNGAWVAAPAAAVGYVASCANERRQWQLTGSAYWRGRYYQCINR